MPVLVVLILILMCFSLVRNDISSHKKSNYTYVLQQPLSAPSVYSIHATLYPYYFAEVCAPILLLLLQFPWNHLLKRATCTVSHAVLITLDQVVAEKEIDKGLT